MKKSIVVGVVLVLLICLAAAVLYWRHEGGQERLPTAPVAEIEGSPEKEVEVGPRHEIPVPPDRAEPRFQTETKAGVAQAPPLPDLNNSDGAVRDLLATLFDVRMLAEVGILNHFIERFVVTIDNLTESQVPLSHLPTRSPEGRFLARGAEGDEFISPDNYRRYAPYVQLLDALNTEEGVSAYVRFYPLLQRAYRELGYPSASFHYRFIEVIDHLLATPDVQEPVALVRPAVLYRLADPELEMLSGGQKILIRIGSENAAKVKNKLREIRLELIESTQNG